MYPIYKLTQSGHTGEQVGGGQTRAQVVRELTRLGVHLDTIPTMPRHGKALIIAVPLAYGPSFSIHNI